MINHFTANVNKADATCPEDLLVMEIRHDEENNANFDSVGFCKISGCQIYIRVYVR